MNAAHRPGPPRNWNPKADKHVYFYSESLDMNFPVSRLDWSDWYEALRASSLHLGNEELLATLLRNASMETRCPDDPTYDMPWYERENYIAGSVITSGWDPPGRQPTKQVPDQQPIAEGLQFKSEPTGVRDPTGRDEWGSWYANVSTRNPQLDDPHLLGELIHAASFAANKAGMLESDQHRYLAHAIISAGWTPPATEIHESDADQATW